MLQLEIKWPGLEQFGTIQVQLFKVFSLDIFRLHKEKKAQHVLRLDLHLGVQVISYTNVS